MSVLNTRAYVTLLLLRVSIRMAVSRASVMKDLALMEFHALVRCPFPQCTNFVGF